MSLHQERACALCRIELNSLGVARGRERLLYDVNMHIHCGEITALIGRNGAGKSTLLKSIAGDVRHSGEILHIREDGSHMARVQVGYVPQQLDLDRSTPASVLDFLQASAGRRPVWLWNNKPRYNAAIAALQERDCAYIADRLLGELSGGELQRVMLTLALHPMPDLLLLDEPVSGMDQSGMENFYQTVSRLRQEHHLAILLVSHDFEMINRYADSVFLLDQTVTASGSPRTVFASSAFHQAFPNVAMREER